VAANSCLPAVRCFVADEREPQVDGTAQESFSLAERLASAYYEWLHDDQRHHDTNFEPVGIVLFSVIAGVTLIIAADILVGFASALNQDAWALVGITTEWAQLPVAVVLLGASLLGWFQCSRTCDEFEAYLNQDESDQREADDIDQTMTLLLRRLNRSRIALACLAVLGLVTAAAGIATVVWYFHSNMNFAVRTPWYGHVAYVAGGLAVGIPALACVVIASRGWARGSYLLRADEPDEAFEDEPESPAEAETDSLATPGSR
jgi:Na+/melibiose symporter-like transporter